MPTPSPATGQVSAEDRACGDFAEEQLASGVGFSQKGIEVLAGCRRARSGQWFVPTGPDDPRLPGGPPLTATEAMATADLRRTITTQLTAFEATLAQTSYYGPSFAKVLGDMESRISPPHKALEYCNRQLYRSVQGPYEEVLVSFIADPDHYALAQYVAWWMSRREAARPPNLALQMNPMLLQAFLDQWDFTRAPWPWELADPLTLDEHLDWALAYDHVPGSAASVGPTPTLASVSPGGVPHHPLYPLSIHIVDSSGAPLPGACVEVVLPLGTSDVCDNTQADKSPATGVIEVRGSPWTYTVRETQPPPGYALVEGVRTIELTTAGADVVLIHARAA